MIFTVFDVLERLSLLMVGHLMHNCKPYVLCQESISPFILPKCAVLLQNVVFKLLMCEY